MTKELYVGLMSGTSVDAIDAVLARFDDNKPTLVASVAGQFPTQLRQQLTTLITQPEQAGLQPLAQAGRELGSVYAHTVNDLLHAANAQPADVRAIGCHGQTVLHQPDGNPAFTLQAGDAATLAVLTGIPVVNDFRSADIALGGQGAPLVPAFHQAAFGSDRESRVILNIGGIANISVLPADGETSGYDTGPGNTLLDYWSEAQLGDAFDTDGQWAESGAVDTALLDSLLADEYFSLPAPKSTGREYFNPRWLERHLHNLAQQPTAADLQATLTELTACSIATAISRSTAAAGASDPAVYVCGGGAHNRFLMTRIATHLPACNIASTTALGIAPDWVEAVAFAWLARARIHRLPGNLPAVTGASRPAILGAIHAP